MWLFYTLLAAVLWGVGQIVIKKGFDHVPPLFNNVLAAILVPILMIPYTLTHGVNFDLIPSILPGTILVAIIFLTYYYIIGIGQVAFTGTIIGTSPAITVLLSLVFLHEQPAIIQIPAIIIIFFGTILLALPEKVSSIKTLHMGSWFWIAFGTAIILGVGDFLIKLLLNHSDINTYLFTYSLALLVVTGISIIFDSKGRKEMPQFNLKQYFPTLIGVSMMEIAFISFNFAISEGLVSIVSPVSSIYVAITAVLAWLVLKEKINKAHAFGIALAAFGIILIGFS